LRAVERRFLEVFQQPASALVREVQECRRVVSRWLGHEESDCRFLGDGPAWREDALVASLTDQERLEECDLVLRGQPSDLGVRGGSRALW
jgi:hypothetical protein